MTERERGIRLIFLDYVCIRYVSPATPLRGWAQCLGRDHELVYERKDGLRFAWDSDYPHVNNGGCLLTVATITSYLPVSNVHF